MRRKALVFLAVLLVFVVLSAWTIGSWYSRYTSLFGGKPIHSVTITDKEGVITLESYLTGDPFLDLNMTLYHQYDRVTIVLGTSSTKDYCDRTGKCRFRTMAAVEVSCLVGKILGAEYYETAREMGYSDAEARKFAFEQVSRRVEAGRWASFSTKLEIGRGDVGNVKHLLIFLRGPLDRAEKDRIYVPREGVLVLEARSDEALYREALVLEGVLGISCSAKS